MPSRGNSPSRFVAGFVNARLKSGQLNQDDTEPIRRRSNKMLPKAGARAVPAVAVRRSGRGGPYDQRIEDKEQSEEAGHQENEIPCRLSRLGFLATKTALDGLFRTRFSRTAFAMQRSRFHANFHLG
jgi:hypothetical protein